MPEPHWGFNSKELMENSSTNLEMQEPNIFERLRRTSPNGGSYWSARDLMPVLGYSKWANLASIISDRVIPSLENQNQPSLSHIAEVGKLAERAQGGGNAQQDFHISRLAAYLLAMNGDPRKPEIAAAQHYFAARTRQAETAKPATLTLTRLQIAELLLESEREAEALRKKQLEDAPKVDAFDALMDSTTLYSVNEAAKLLGTGRERLFAFLRDAEVLMHAPSSWNQPYQQHLDAKRFEVKTRTFDIKHADGSVETRSSATTFVTGKGLEYIRKLLERERAA